MTVGDSAQDTNTLFLALVPQSRVMLSPSTDKSVCEIDHALPLDTTTSEALPSIMWKVVIMMIDGFIRGIFPTFKGCIVCVKTFLALLNIHL